MNAPEGIPISGVVRDAGGGVVEVLVDRDTERYPSVGDGVTLMASSRETTPRNPDVRLTTDRRITVETIHTLCPVCAGRGTVRSDFYNQFGSATSTAPETCRRCEGGGTIPGTRTVTT